MASIWDYLPAPGSGRPYLEKAAREVWRFIPPELRGKVQATGELATMIAPGSGTLEASNQAPQIAADLRSSAYGSAAASTATGILGMAADFWPGAKALLPDGRGILPMASRSPRIYD